MEKKVMVFGVFDGLHAGHIFFIEEARKYGTNIIVSVAKDETVYKLKNKYPKYNLKDRMESIKNKFKDATVIAGDAELYSWKGIFDQKPDVVVCGHDQESLKSALIKNEAIMKIIKDCIVIPEHNRDTLSSTFLREDL